MHIQEGTVRSSEGRNRPSLGRNSSYLEMNLQRDLDLASVLTRSAGDGAKLIRSVIHIWRIEGVLVKEVEEIPTKVHGVLLAKHPPLGQRRVPVPQALSEDGVSASVAPGPESGQ